MSLQINCLACHILAKQKLLSKDLTSHSLRSPKNKKSLKKSVQSTSSLAIKTKEESKSNIFPLKKIA